MFIVLVHFAFLQAIGRMGLASVQGVGAVSILMWEVLLSCIKGKFRFKILCDQILSIGVQSQPVVLVTGVFTGAVLEAQSLFQLQIVRMETMGGAIVAVGMFRELGPVIAGLMLAGRVGSAMAAEIGTMQVTEQVDALRSMNISPVDYLVKPRIQAMLISSPVLMLESVIVGIVAAYFVMKGFNVNEAYWIHTMTNFISLGDMACAIIKTSVFGLLIGIISCRQGLITSNGAVGVGRSTMKAMVYSSVAILIANFILAIVLNQFFPMGLMK